MNRNAKHQLSKTHTALVRSMMKSAAGKVQKITFGVVWFFTVFGADAKFGAPNYLLHYAGIHNILEKGVYCYCYSTNNFWFDCAGEECSNLTQKEEKKTDWQSYFLHFGSSHCMFRIEIAVIPPHWLEYWTYDWRSTWCRPQNQFAAGYLPLFMFLPLLLFLFFHFSWNARNGIIFPQADMLRHRCGYGHNWITCVIIYR